MCGLLDDHEVVIHIWIGLLLNVFFNLLILSLLVESRSLWPHIALIVVVRNLVKVGSVAVIGVLIFHDQPIAIPIVVGADAVVVVVVVLLLGFLVLHDIVSLVGLLVEDVLAVALRLRGPAIRVYVLLRVLVVVVVLLVIVLLVIVLLIIVVLLVVVVLLVIVLIVVLLVVVLVAIVLVLIVGCLVLLVLPHEKLVVIELLIVLAFDLLQ